MRVHLHGGTAWFRERVREALRVAGHEDEGDAARAGGLVLLGGAASGGLEALSREVVGKAAALLDRAGEGLRRIVVVTPGDVYGEGPAECADCGRVRPSNRRVPAERPWEPRCPRCEGKLEPVPVREDEKVQPATPTASLWLAREDLVLSWARLRGAPATALRVAEIFGPGADMGWAAEFLRAAQSGLAAQVPEDGAGTRDFLHVDDAAAAVAAALASTRVAGEPLNVGTGRPCSFAAAAAALGGSAAGSGTGGAEPRDLTLDALRFRHAAGWRPRVSLLP